ncbi:MAG: DoxX family protein [Pseudomonadota bacterium]
MAIVSMLNRMRAFEDVSLLVLRLFVGSFLVWGVSDNLFRPEDMAEFVAFVQANGFAFPLAMAWISVCAQFVCGLLFIAGALTRWAALIMVFNFIVALIMVHLGDDYRGMFPVLALIFISLHFAARGAGAYALDKYIEARTSNAPA